MGVLLVILTHFSKLMISVGVNFLPDRAYPIYEVTIRENFKITNLIDLQENAVKMNLLINCFILS